MAKNQRVLILVDIDGEIYQFETTLDKQVNHIIQAFKNSCYFATDEVIIPYTSSNQKINIHETIQCLQANFKPNQQITIKLPSKYSQLIEAINQGMKSLIIQNKQDDNNSLDQLPNSIKQSIVQIQKKLSHQNNEKAKQQEIQKEVLSILQQINSERAQEYQSLSLSECLKFIVREFAEKQRKIDCLQGEIKTLKQQLEQKEIIVKQSMEREQKEKQKIEGMYEVQKSKNLELSEEVTNKTYFSCQIMNGQYGIDKKIICNLGEYEGSKINKLKCLLSLNSFSISYEVLKVFFNENVIKKSEKILFLIQIKDNILVVYSEGYVYGNESPQSKRRRGFLYSHAHQQRYQAKKQNSKCLINLRMMGMTVCNKLQIESIVNGTIRLDSSATSSVQTENFNQIVFNHKKQPILKFQIFTVHFETQNKTKYESQIMQQI